MGHWGSGRLARQGWSRFEKVGHRHGVLLRGDLEEVIQLWSNWESVRSSGDSRRGCMSMYLAKKLFNILRRSACRSSVSVSTRAEVMNQKFVAGSRHKNFGLESD